MQLSVFTKCRHTNTYTGRCCSKPGSAHRCKNQRCSNSGRGQIQKWVKQIVGTFHFLPRIPKGGEHDPVFSLRRFREASPPSRGSTFAERGGPHGRRGQMFFPPNSCEETLRLRQRRRTCFFLSRNFFPSASDFPVTPTQGFQTICRSRPPHHGLNGPGVSQHLHQGRLGAITFSSSDIAKARWAATASIPVHLWMLACRAAARNLAGTPRAFAFASWRANPRFLSDSAANLNAQSYKFARPRGDKF